MADDELLYNFNKILLEKREEIIEISKSKKREIKKVINPNILNKDTKDTLNRLKVENEKKIKSSKAYKKKMEEEK
jgi:stalled ribosome alternative rescue factor ArfA